MGGLKKIFAKLSFRAHPAEGGELTREKVRDDWKMWVLACLAFLLGVTAWNIYAFLEIEKGDFFISEAPPRSSITPLDKELLTKTIQFYEDKASHFESRMGSTTSYTDPSR